MKYLRIIVGLCLLVTLLVLYFQLYAGSNVSVPFFTEWIEIKKWTMMVMSISFLAGVSLTLGLSKGFTPGSNIDDDFDL